MKKHLIVLMLSMQFSFFLTNGFASNHFSHQDLSLLPFIYDEKQFTLDPLKVTSFSLGKSYVSYQNKLISPFQKHNWFESQHSYNFQFKVELPTDQLNTSWGFEWSLFVDNIGIQNLVANNPFSNIAALEMLGTWKFKYPIYTKLGSFAFTLTPKIGLIDVLAATPPDFPVGVKEISECIEMLSMVGNENIDQARLANFQRRNQELFEQFQASKAVSEYYFCNLGFVLGGSLGIDYYLKPWLGVFAEYSIKYNNMAVRLNKKLPTKAYQYYTDAFTVGFKTTF